MLLVDAEGACQFVGGGPAAQVLLGFDGLELASRSVAELIHPDDEVRVRKAFRALAAAPGEMHTVEYRVRHRNASWVKVESTAVNRLDNPVIAAIVVHTREVTASEAPPSGQVHALTQLPDRAMFTASVSDAVARALAEPTYGFSVLMIELDKLRMLVGTYGQEIVDELVIEVGRRLSVVLKAHDTLAHVGSGEFGVLLDGLRDRVHASRVADKIQKALAARYRLGEHTITVAVIMGIATSERQYERAEHVLRDASLAASRARGPGSRRAVFQTQMRVEDSRYMQTLSGLYTALQSSQFRLHYQPIVSLVTGTLAGFEALIRWYHPEHGLIPPMSFIPIAEETGLIVPIGRWVLEEACAQMARWNELADGDRTLYMSVNLSTKQFVEENLPGLVEAAVSASGIDAAQLKLEITETAVLENLETAATMIRRIKASGVRVSLDDFGTGYSSFSYLHQLPYDTLKVDRSFVCRLEDGEDSSEIVHAIIALAHNLRMDVVAEGVETQRQADKLLKMGCEYAQGYHFAKPMSAEDGAELIVARPKW